MIIIETTKICQQCSQKFNTKNKNRKFCSVQCSANSKKQGLFIKCQQCKKEFYISNSRKDIKKFCSVNCANTAQRTNFNENFFEDNNKQVAYWSGFLMADGSVRYNKSSCKLSLNTSDKDKEQMEKYVKALNISDGFSYRENEYGKYYSVSVSSPRIKIPLLNFGIIPNKTYIGCPPDNLDTTLLFHYIRGLIDGDGSIIKSKSIKQQINLTNNEQTCKWLQKNIEKHLDIKSNIYLKNINKKNNHKTYRWVIYSKKDVVKLLNCIYDNSSDDIRLSRKYQTALKILE